MSLDKKEKTNRTQTEKSRLHARNKNRERYDLAALKISSPELTAYTNENKYGVESIDFSNPRAVKLLNKAILKYYYGIKNWDFPNKNLCPPVPGRADYIHYLADLLAENNWGEIPTGEKITCFDIGTGASCIYPILGIAEYGWEFIASDIDSKSIASAQNIINSNPALKNKVDFRLQNNNNNIFRGVITMEEKIDIVICNPPFHSSLKDAQQGSSRKVQNLSGKKVNKPVLNFAGIGKELIYEGGEIQFLQNMIQESKMFSKNFYWFSSLVSKQSNLKAIQGMLEKVEASEIRVIPMGTGNKISRIVAWTFLSREEEKQWISKNWSK